MAMGTISSVKKTRNVNVRLVKGKSGINHRFSLLPTNVNTKKMNLIFSEEKQAHFISSKTARPKRKATDSEKRTTDSAELKSSNLKPAHIRSSRFPLLPRYQPTITTAAPGQSSPVLRR